MKCNVEKLFSVFIAAAALLFTLAMAAPSAFAGDEFGIAFAPAVEKKLPAGMTFSVETEIRSRDQSKALERLAAGAYFGIKPISYFKAEIGYTFIDQYKSETVKNNGMHVDSFWAPKHELEASVFGYLPLGVIELSIRERYEYTYHHEVTAKQWYDDDAAKTSGIAKASKTEQVLRSRLQIAAKIPNTGFSPYGSIDVYQKLADGGELFNFRVLFGGDYAVTPCHKIGAYFRADLFYSTLPNYLLGLKYRFVF